MKIIKRNKILPVHIDILFFIQSLLAIATPIKKMLSLH